MKEEFIRNNIKMLSHIKNELSHKNSLLFSLMISGSHLYGFNSKESDIDYRGIFVQNTENILSLARPIESINIPEGDIQLFEIKKFIQLALKGNCNVLEHLNADQLFNTSRYVELKRLINNSFGKRGLTDSYRGMATFNYKKFILAGRQNAKKYLYVFRALMAGIYVLQTGRIEPNMIKLNTYFKSDNVKQLIKIKQAGDMVLPDKLLDGRLEKEIDMLFNRLDQAYDKSKIPIVPTDDDIERVNRFLIDLRTESIGNSTK